MANADTEKEERVEDGIAGQVEECDGGYGQHACKDKDDLGNAWTMLVVSKLLIFPSCFLVQAVYLAIVNTDFRSFSLVRSLLLTYFRDTQEAEIAKLSKSKSKSRLG